ncbi:unnamed protein product [Parnassius apollo]|uniref:(apollo) hypothetical protein n=1 Tax=Parnassius apollo TaxID=110799 RepID=A0A8S3XEB4_PARAO|nr:unnamed protein product [Parnassius apollo]
MRMDMANVARAAQQCQAAARPLGRDALGRGVRRARRAAAPGGCADAWSRCAWTWRTSRAPRSSAWQLRGRLDAMRPDVASVARATQQRQAAVRVLGRGARKVGRG